MAQRQLHHEIFLKHGRQLTTTVIKEDTALTVSQQAEHYSFQVV